MYYEVELIEMGFCKPDFDESSTTADSSEWHNPLHPDIYNVLVTKHADDGSGQVEMLYDIDFKPEHAGKAQALFLIFEDIAIHANVKEIEFGTVKNPYV